MSPDGGLAMTTVGASPSQDDDDTDGPVAVAEADAAVSCVDVDAPMPPALAVSMMAVVVSIDHLGRRCPCVVKFHGTPVDDVAGGRNLTRWQMA